MSDIHAYWDISVEFRIDNGELRMGEDYEILTGFNAHYYLYVDMSNFHTGSLNTHRIVALDTTSSAYREHGIIRSILGGSYDPTTEMFRLATNHTEPIMITYARNLIRLNLNLNSPVITDIAGNAPTQTMDVRPIIQNDRTLIPIRFIGEALGADIGWTNATDAAPLIVHITIDGQTLNIPIGEVTPQLAALGMDVPAQLMDNRTMVPLRFVSEFFGAMVEWDNSTRSIEIISIGASATPPANPNSQFSTFNSQFYNDRSAIIAIERASRGLPPDLSDRDRLLSLEELDAFEL